MFRVCNTQGVKKRAFSLQNIGTLLLVLILMSCGSNESISLPDVFPDANTFPGWTLAGEMETFGRENLFDLVNGQAEAFFVYNFEQVAVQNYENVDGVKLGVEIWQFASPADAYGLFTASIAGAPAAIGNGGDAYPGRRLAFWQDRYYVHVRARQEVDEAELRNFAEAVSTALPTGGEQPALVNRLPSEGLVGRSPIFFHEEISIQNEIWLGGENLLGLSPETDGILARYEIGDGMAHLLLVQYPDAAAASAGLAELEGGQVDGFVVAEARDNLLGAVFGEIDEVTATMLLKGVFDNQ